MIAFIKRIGYSRLIEIGLLAVILYSVTWSYRFFQIYGYLPQPYFFDTNDTFMDWINVAQWSHVPGTYDQFESVYPPLSFAFLRFFSPASCYVYDKFYARECDWMFPWVMGFFYILNAFLAFKCYFKNDRKTAWIRTIALVLGLPMLFGVERGQLIIPTFTAFILAHGNILRSARWKWLCAAFTINFKLYLILAIIPQFMRRRWAALEAIAISSIAIYILTYGIIGDGTLTQIIRNITKFNETPEVIHFQNAYYQPTYQGVTLALDSAFPFMNYIGSNSLEFMLWFFPLLSYIGLAGIAACFALMAWKPLAAPVRRMVALAVAAVITNTIAGGYTEILVIFLVFFEPWRGPARIAALVAAYLLSISADTPLATWVTGTETSYLSQRIITWNVGLNLGELVRPGLLLLIEYALIGQTLWDVWKARKPVSPAPSALLLPA